MGDHSQPECRERGRRVGPRRREAAAMWSALALYAALATCAVMEGLSATHGPPWECLLGGMSLLPPAAQAGLVASAVAVFGSWWRLHEDEGLGEFRASTPKPGPEEEE